MLRYVKFTFGTFQQRKLRSLLTMIGIVIGIALIVTLISLGQGLKSSITQQFESMGTDKIIITPGGSESFFGIGQVGIKLTDKDIDTVKKTPGINHVAGLGYKIAKVKYRDETKYTWLLGIPTDESFKVLETLQNFKVIDGRQLQKEDKYSVTIGTRLYSGKKDMLFEKAVSIRDKMEIEGQEFKVVGQMTEAGNPEDDSQIYIPLDTFIELFGGKKEYGMIYTDVSDPAKVEEIASNLKKDLRKSRDVKEGEEDFTVQTMSQILDSFSVILNVVQAVLIGLAAISITVGGVGIMNTMYTSVLERTREIGIMKAIGAKNADIILLFLIEAGVLGLLGGIIGTAIGLGMSKSIEFAAFYFGYSFFKVQISMFLIIGSVLFSFIVGSIAGILPALRAAKLSPVEALRYE